MRQPINFICNPECEISVSPDLSKSAELSADGTKQALAIGQALFSHAGEVSLFTSSEAGALIASRAIAHTANIPTSAISSLLNKNTTRANFEVDGKVEVLGLDEVGLPVYTELDKQRMLNFYRMVSCDPYNMPTYAVTEKDSITALLNALDINNKGSEIQPGSITSLVNIYEDRVVAVTTTPKIVGENHGSQDILAA